MSTKNNLSIADKTEQLNTLVAWFNSDAFVLEEALNKFTEAEKLANEIERELQELKNSITIVKAKFSEG
jgi:exonuclease VII small subunit